MKTLFNLIAFASLAANVALVFALYQLDTNTGRAANRAHVELRDAPALWRSVQMACDRAEAAADARLVKAQRALKQAEESAAAARTRTASTKDRTEAATARRAPRSPASPFSWRGRR